MPLATLTIDLEARLAKLAAGMDSAVRLAEKNANAIAGAYDSVRTSLATVGATVAASFGGAQLAAFFRQTVDGIDALNDFADAVGTSVENASALEDAAVRTGTSLDTVESAALRLNKALADAKPGSDTAKLLQTIGLSAEELRRLDPAKALLELAKALQLVDDKSQAAIVLQLMGKQAREVAPFLKDLAAQGRLVATVTKEQALEAERYNQQLAALQKNITDAARSLTSELLPALNGYFDKLKGLPAGRQIFGAELFSEVQSARLTLAVTKVEDLQDALSKDPGNKALSDALRTARADADALLKSATSANNALRTLVAPGQQGRRPANEGGGGLRSRSVDVATVLADAPKAEKAPRRSYDVPADPGLTAALRALEQTDAGRIAELQARLSALFDLQRETRGAPAVVQAIKATREELEKLQTAPIGPAISDQEERLRSEFLLSEKSSYDATDKALRDVAERTKETSDLAKELGLSFASAAEDALVFGGTAGDVLKGLEQDIKRILARQLITEPLANGIGELLKGLGVGSSTGAGASGPGWGAAAAVWLKGLFAGEFAEGGYIPPGRWGIAGERGPEPVFGGRTGKTVVPNGGGGSIVINYHMPAGGMSTASQSQVAADTARLLSIANRRNN